MKLLGSLQVFQSCCPRPIHCYYATFALRPDQIFGPSHRCLIVFGMAVDFHQDLPQVGNIKTLFYTLLDCSAKSHFGTNNKSARRLTGPMIGSGSPILTKFRHCFCWVIVSLPPFSRTFLIAISATMPKAIREKSWRTATIGS